jgi:hypothetical protein
LREWLCNTGIIGEMWINLSEDGECDDEGGEEEDATGKWGTRKG